MQKSILLVGVLLLSSVVFALQVNLDSITKMLLNSKTNTTTVNTFLDVMNKLTATNPSKAKEIGKKAFDLSKKLDYYKGKLNASRGLGSIFIVEGSLDSALYHCQYSLDLAITKNDSLNIGISYLQLGSTYRRLSDFQSALDYLTKAGVVLEREGDKKLQVEVNDALQLFYFSLPNYEKAIIYGNKAVTLARELRSSSLLMQTLSNLSLSYNEIGEYDASKKILIEAQLIAGELKDYNAESAILLNLAGVFLKQKDYSTLQQYANKALGVNRKIGSKEGECISLRALAIASLHRKEYVKATELALNALKIAQSKEYKLEMADCYKVLSNISFAEQDLVQGEVYFEKSNKILEEIFNVAYLEAAAQTEKKYESEKKDTQIKLQQLKLQRNNTLNYILTSASFVLILLIFLLYKNYKHKQKIQFHRINELEKEKQLTATEAVLKGEEKERIRMARDLHDGLGGMLSGIKFSFQAMRKNLIMTPDNQLSFERSMDMLDSSIREMRRVAHNMMPESLVKFGLDTAAKDFCKEINASGVLEVSYQSIGMTNSNLNQTVAITIYRILQELINNTIKHAKAKNAIVQLTFTDRILSLTVEDDGRGFKTENLKNIKGIGWKNINNRIDFLGGTVQIDSKEGNGTSVHIEIKT